MKSSLCRNYFDIVRDKTSDTQAVGIPQDFYSALTYTCGGSSIRSELEMSVLLAECSTWRLIGMLQEDIMENGTMESSLSDDGKYKCDSEIIEDLFMRSSELRHLKVIVDWLQESAGDIAQQLYHACEIRWPSPIDFWSSLNDETYGEKVKSSKRLGLDAIFDDCSLLSPSLAEDVDLLYRTVFHLLRAGDLSRAQDLCVQVGHQWLAVAIGGHRFFEDCPYEKLDANLDVGNRHRLLWQSVAWAWLEQASSMPEKGNVYERAVFGLLCGRLESVLPVCQTWHDRVWACVTCYVNIKTTKELLEKSRENTECFLPVTYFDQLKDVSSILRVADEGSKQQYATLPLFERVQKCLIAYGLDHFTDLLSFFLEVAGKLRNKELVDYSLDDLRFCVHMLQWLKVLGITPASDPALAPIYLNYISGLSFSPDNVDMAAFYNSQMPKPVDSSVFVSFLNSCLAKVLFSAGDEDNFIKRALFEARAANLNVGEVLDKLLQNRLSRDEFDENAIVHSLTWYYLLEPMLTTTDSVMVDFLRYSNSTIRSFLLNGKHDLARAVFRNIRTETVTLIAAPTLRASLSPDERAASPNSYLIREYLCFKALFLAFDRLSDWNATYSAYLQSSKQQKDSSEFRDLQRVTEELMQSTYNVLLFAGPGWLVDENSSQSTEERQLQLDQLRRHFIPELTLSLMLCLARIGQTRRVDRVRLVDALMSSHPRNLAALFTPQQLTVIARSASCILAE